MSQHRFLMHILFSIQKEIKKNIQFINIQH